MNKVSRMMNQRNERLTFYQVLGAVIGLKRVDCMHFD